LRTPRISGGDGLAFGRRAAQPNPDPRPRPPHPKQLQKPPAAPSKPALLPRPASRPALPRTGQAARSLDRRNPITGEKVAAPVPQRKTGMFTDKPSDRILKAGDPFSKASKTA